MSNQPSTEKVSFREALKQAPKRFWDTCKHNWGWKLLSLFLAICLWAGLINQDPTLTRKRTFNDVSISVSGENTLLGNGLIILSGLDSGTLTADMEVQVPQRNYSTSHPTNFSPRVDVSKITSTGEQTLRIQTTSSTTYGTVQSVSPDSFTVVVDEYVTNYRVPVTVVQSGSYPEGFYGPAPVLNPSVVAISGPRTIVDTIAYVAVDYDPSIFPAQEGEQRVALPMRIIDKQGEQLPTDKLRVTSASVVLRSIVLEQRLYPMQEMNISNLVNLSGTPAAGYEVKSITTEPATIYAAGDSLALDSISTLFATAPVDVSGRSESFTVDLTIRKPSSLTYLSTDTVKAQIEIGPVITSRSFENVKLTAQNLSPNLSATLPTKTVSVTVTGPENTLKTMTTAKVKAYVDLSNLMEGDMLLPVLATFGNIDPENLSYTVNPADIQVTITAQ